MLGYRWWLAGNTALSCALARRRRYSLVMFVVWPYTRLSCLPGTSIVHMFTSIKAPAPPTTNLYITCILSQPYPGLWSKMLLKPDVLFMCCSSGRLIDQTCISFINQHCAWSHWNCMDTSFVYRYHTVLRSSIVIDSWCSTEGTVSRLYGATCNHIPLSM